MKMNAFVSLGALCAVSQVAMAVTIDLESLTPRDTSLAGSYWVGNPGFTSNGATFSGGSFSGLAVSNSTNLSGYGYFYLGGATATSEISAYALPTGGGASGSSKFAIAYDTSVIDLPAGQSPTSIQVTNTTTAYFSLLNGDGFAKKFGGLSGNDPDLFNLVFTGKSLGGGAGSTIGIVTFPLADYTSANNAQDYIVKNWTSVDLTPLAGAASIALSWTSTDTAGGFINTPTYAALDNLVTIPEPTTLAAVGIGALFLRRRRF